jgi:putative FmdB family regulatory protein
MPLYEYICPQCKSEFELRLSIDANCTPVCPKCYSEAQRLISSFACKTGGNIQAAEKPFRQGPAPDPSATRGAGGTSTPSVLITPPPNRIELLSPPGKRSTRAGRKKK